MTFTIASNSVYDPIHSQIQGQLMKPEKDRSFPFTEDTHTCLASCCFAQHPFHPLSKDSTLLPPPAFPLMPYPSYIPWDSDVAANHNTASHTWTQ